MQPQEKTTISKLYQDLDEKLYIITSLNNQDNTQLMKLDKEFDKLYEMVKRGMDTYIPATGGSMKGGSMKGYMAKPKVTTQYLYML
jgi:hypothetical protein